MANKVLSIECGRSIVRVVEASMSPKEVKVFQAFSFAAPEGLFDGTANAEFAGLLRRELKLRKISTKKVVFVVNSGRMASREVIIPSVKENRIRGLIEANASDYFPVELSQYALVHEVIERYKEEGNARIRLNILAVPHDLIDFYEVLAKDSGLSIVGMDYSGNSARQIIKRTPEKNVRALFKVDGKSSLITIMKGDMVVFQRHLTIGISDMVHTLMESGIFGDLNFMQALQMLKTDAYLNDEETDAVINNKNNQSFHLKDARAELKEEIVESLHTLVSSVGRIVDYYQTRNQDDKIEKLYLIGMGAYIKDFDTFLTSEIGIPTEVMHSLANVVITRSAREVEAGIAEYYTCIGIAFHSGSSLSTYRKKTKKEKGERAKADATGGPIWIYLAVFLLFVVVSGGLYYYTYLKNDEEKNKKAELTARLESYQYIHEVIKENELAKADYEWAKNLNAGAHSFNKELVSFLEEMEEKMPSEIRVVSLNSTSNTVSLSINVDSKEAVADVLKQFRTFDNVIVGNVSSITEEKTDDGVLTVSFSVDLAYVDLAISDEGEEKLEGEEGSERK